MITRTVFETADGQRFNSKAKAKVHEVDLETLDQLECLFDVSVKTGRPKAILRHMLVHPTETANILRRYQRRQPKSA